MTIHYERAGRSREGGREDTWPPLVIINWDTTHTLILSESELRKEEKSSLSFCLSTLQIRISSGLQSVPWREFQCLLFDILIFWYLDCTTSGLVLVSQSVRPHQPPYIVNKFYCFQLSSDPFQPNDSMVCALIDELPVYATNEPFVKCLSLKQMFLWGSRAYGIF